MTYYSQLTGKTYDSAEARDHYEERERMRRNGPSAEELKYEGLSAEQLREFIQGEMDGDRAKQQRAVNAERGEAWALTHPEFINDETSKEGEYNAMQMANYFALRGITAPAWQDFEDAYQFLRSKGLLILDPKELQKERKRKLVALAQRETKNVALEQDEDALNAMPLDELRLRADGII
jgi:hypothetical protein